MSSTIKRIWNIFTTVLVVAAVLLAAALAGVRLLGFQVFTVLSGSMEPEYPVGSLIYVKEVDYTQLKPRDVITFMLGENTIATHRITEVLIDENDPTVRRFFTKVSDAHKVIRCFDPFKNISNTLNSRPTKTVEGTYRQS